MTRVSEAGRTGGGEAGAPPPLEKRSVSLAGHRTSVALEPEYWAVVERMAAQRGLSVAAVVASVDRTRGPRNLASAIRVAILKELDQGGRGA